MSNVWVADVSEYCLVPTKNSPEARVVYSLKQHLLSEGLRGGRVSEVIVDADGAYQASPHAKALEPMATIWIDGFRPDLVCSVRQESCTLVAGFEVKADIADWPKGLTQARVYRNGVHHAFLAVPFSANGRTRALEKEARDSGIGVLMLEGAHWHEAVPPADPRPLPAKLQVTSLALEGVPAARKLQLNHPLNYLVVPYLRLLDGQAPLISLMEEHWPDLQAVTSRRYAIEGARVLGLIDADGWLTPKGATIADLLQGVGFLPENRPGKRLRLADAAPAVAADFRTATVFQFKQILWHAGIPVTKAERGAVAERTGIGRREDGDDRKMVMTERWVAAAIFLSSHVSVSQGCSGDDGVGMARACRGQIDSHGRAECDNG